VEKNANSGKVRFQYVKSTECNSLEMQSFIHFLFTLCCSLQQKESCGCFEFQFILCFMAVFTP
jgi:hypothetical protein